MVFMQFVQGYVTHASEPLTFDVCSLVSLRLIEIGFTIAETACKAYSAKRQKATLIPAPAGVESATPFIPGSVKVSPTLKKAVRFGQ
jgi:hypothetical protein